MDRDFRPATPSGTSSGHWRAASCFSCLFVSTCPVVLWPGDEPLFGFGTRMAMKVLDRAAKITGARCIPGGQKVTLKDLRSSMACDLLSKGWTTDEVNQRLGHRPSSREIDKYVNWLALDRDKPKRRFHENHVRELEQQVTKLQESEKLAQQRQDSLRAELSELRDRIDQNNRQIHAQLLKLAQHIQNIPPEGWAAQC